MLATILTIVPSEEAEEEVMVTITEATTITLLLHSTIPWPTILVPLTWRILTTDLVIWECSSNRLNNSSNLASSNNSSPTTTLVEVHTTILLPLEAATECNPAALFSTSPFHLKNQEKLIRTSHVPFLRMYAPLSYAPLMFDDSPLSQKKQC
mmetsp:Transcript_9760/g.18673  ORF Transcript_9760/g.18673 Transcript_9760/m.18673 type:complete len:152 (-) Transcript_9760:78-533(-)